MMREEDEVFLSDTESGSASRGAEYTQIFGDDDAASTNRDGGTTSAKSQSGSASTGRPDDGFDDLDVIINDPKVKKLQRKRSSHRSESSEDDFYGGSQFGDGATKPLMHPRPRPKNQLSMRQRRLRRCCTFSLYSVLVAGGLLSLAFGIVHFMQNYADDWLHIPRPPTWSNQTVVGCSSLSLEAVWIKGIPKLMTESAFRLVDVNEDGVLDVLFGFATGAEGYKVPDIVCDIYFNGTRPCLGGILALDGRTGIELWRHYSEHEIFAINCERDMDDDGIKDCLIAGRVGGFEAVSGRDGRLLWRFTHAARISAMNVYTAQFVRDLNGDGIPDIVNIHGGDPFGEPGSETRLTGRIFLFSGLNGHVLQWVDVPDGRESYYSPVIYTRRDGTDMVVFGTGGETHPGSLWYISLDDLYHGDIKKAQQIVHNPYKGFMTPPVMLDLTGDGVLDLVFASYNSTVLAVDGETYELLWNFSYPMSETYATPSPGYYNDDDIPDFMVHWQYGPGFPVYYHSITTILDGKDGTPILKPYVKSSVGAQSSPLTISVEGLGNDIFLYWYADCLGHEGQGGNFQFVEGTNVHEQSRSDVCRLRFKTEGFSKLFALSRHQKAPGKEIYYSEENGEVEHSAWVNATKEAIEFLKKHPEYMENYNIWRDWVMKNIMEVKVILFQKEGIQPNLKSAKTTEEDLREHLRQSLAVITGQLREPSMQYEPTNQRSSMYESSNKKPSEDYLANKLPSKLHPTTNQLSESGDLGVKPQNVLQKILSNDYPQTDSSNIDWPRPVEEMAAPSDDAASDDYLKLLYDSLGNGGGELQDYLQRYLDAAAAGSRDADGQIAFSDVTGKLAARRKKRKPHRSRRHVGPHDEGGLQRLISTGTLAPPLLSLDHPDYEHSTDIVFATYWFYPAKTEALLPEDQECIDERMKTQSERFDPNGKYFGMDDDGFAHAVTKECLEKSNHQLADEGTYNNQHTYNPYNIHMGQLTVYRMRLKCRCGKLTRNQRCSRIFPYDKQQWSAYMGPEANSHWRHLGNAKHIIDFPPHEQSTS